MPPAPPPDPLWFILPSVIGAISGLVGAVGGALLGAWLSQGNEVRKQRIEYAKQQLSEFYSPILSLQKSIRALGELRKNIDDAVNEVYLPADPKPVANRVAAREETARALNGITEFNNEQMRLVLMPMYREMLKVFREKWWLADDDVRQHHYKLVEFVELWRRHLDRTIPGEVVAKFYVEEAKVKPLYDALEAQFKRRQLILEKSDPDAKA